MKLFVCALIAACLPLAAAEPDWPKVEQHALELLQRYIRIASVNPPADTKATAELFRAELESNGLTPQIFNAGPGGQTNLMIRIPGRDRTKKPLLLLNHFDVVPVDAKAWSVDPFGAEIKDGNIWGRGSLDMKGIGVQQLTALIALHNAGIVPARDIVMLSTADEESNGERGIQWMIANHYAEFEPEYVIDEGGLGSRDMLAQGKLVFGVSVGEKQMMWLRLRAKGTAGHGSQPIPDNANMILMAAIQKALEFSQSGKANPVIDEMKTAAGGQLAVNKFTAAIQHNTISLTTLAAGVGSPLKPNVIPSISEATLDCRLMPGVNADEFLSEIKARINDPRVTIERLNAPVDAGASRSDTPLFAAIRGAIQKEHPDAVVTPMFVPFGTDSVHLRKRGVTAYGLTPMILDTATAATMHSDQERIPVREFKQGIRIFYDVLCSRF
jgi:acetylornithine deacetylase/succinyl-diaminopimelate desuccinylase-like protein